MQSRESRIMSASHLPPVECINWIRQMGGDQIVADLTEVLFIC